LAGTADSSILDGLGHIGLPTLLLLPGPTARDDFPGSTARAVGPRLFGHSMKSAQFTTLVIVSLVALRLACGWLFFREGSKKLDSGGKFRSAHFLKDATGPLDSAYEGLVPDVYGGIRLSANDTDDIWEKFQEDAGDHFGFDKEQKIKAKLTMQRAVAGLRGYLADIGNDYAEHIREGQRLDRVERDDPTADVNYRSTWLEKETAKQDVQLSGWLAKAEDLWNKYERDINSIATHDQMTSAGYFELPRASASFVDTVIPWFTFIVGVLLVLGLLTRAAAVGGSVFLFSVISTQPPWEYAAADTNYQIIVLCALAVIAAVGAGRWGGLDYFLGLCCSGCCRRTSAETAATPTK
jgi:uncharacterized membrane protein YphA (DoxX/SURF4 family)